MIKILLAIALLCGAVFVGPRLADSQGFVHIATEGFIIETSLTTAIIITFVTFLVLHVLVNIINSSIRLPGSASRWFGNRRSKKQMTLQNEAFMAYEEGAYNRALALINKSGDRDSLPANCLLLGAKCAFKAGDLNSCRSFIEQAEKAPDSSEIACRLLRARLNMQIGNINAAIENIESVKQDSYSRAITTRLLYECYKSSGNYDKLQELLPTLKKLDIVDDQEASLINMQAARARLSGSATVEELDSLVSGMARAERHDPVVMAPVLTRMVKLGDTEKSGKYALDILRHNPAPEFLDSISRWSAAVPAVLNELSAQTKGNAIGSQTNVPLLKALANMEMKSDRLAEAKEHLKQALDVTKDRDLYLLAAELNERLDRYEEASKFFALALKQ